MVSPRSALPRRLLAPLLITAASATLAEGPDFPTADPSSVGMSAQRLERIGPAMDKYIDSQRVPGTVTLIAREGKIVHYEAQGYMDVDASKPMRKDAIFRIASMTKPIASVALMMLWEEGEFQLSDPVSKFIPAFADQQVSTTSDASGETGELVPVEQPATIRHLLTHTAGMANSYMGNTDYYGEQSDIRDDDTLESYVNRLASLPLNYQPGEAWQYSHATDVVGRLVEVISGQSLPAFMRQRIFEPLGMDDTHFWMEGTKGGRLMAQYQPGEDDTIRLDDPGTEESRWITGQRRVARGAGGLVSTAEDYLRFQQAMLNGGELNGQRLLAPSTVSLMMENHTGDLPLWLPGPGMGFGLGWAVVEDRGEAATPFSEGSAYWGGAYATLSWIDREQDLIGIVMTQVRPYDHINVREDFQVLTYQALIDSEY